MSRIRSIHPGIWTDETFAALSDSAFRLYLGLLTEADDQGIFEWKPLQLRMRLRPAADGSVDPQLEELEAHDVVHRFALGGRVYGAIRNFCKYQKPKFPKFVHPTSSEIADYVASKALATPEEDSSTPPPTVADRVELDTFPRNAEKTALMEMEDGVKEGKGGSLRSQSARERDAISIAVEFETKFWPAYPNKVSKPNAAVAFLNARRGTRARGKPPREPASLERIMLGLGRYVETHPNFWLNPASFLNGEHYDDQPASPSNGGSGRPKSPHDAIREAFIREAEKELRQGGDGPGPDGRDDDHRAGPDGAGGQHLDLGTEAFRRAG